MIMQVACMSCAHRADLRPPSTSRQTPVRKHERGEDRNSTAEAALRTRPDFANPLGTTHGGICATLLDSVMGSAVHTTMDAGVGCATLELKINYIRTVPTDGRRLTATGTIIHVGRTTATAEGRVVDDQGRLVAHATTTCVIFR
jgi:uncharacterized protein (TIGR00369 family)